MGESTELEVRDFGPIVKAKIDLRPLTVFVGPSNTGKSYLAILIYALHRCFGSREGLFRRSYRHPFSEFRNQKILDLSKQKIKILLEQTQSIYEKLIEEKESSVVLPSQISELIRCRYEETASDVANEIKRCFGMGDVDQLSRKEGKNQAQIVIRRPTSSNSKTIEYSLTLAQTIKFKSIIPDTIPISSAISSGLNQNLKMFKHIFYRFQKRKISEKDVEYLKYEALDLISEFIGSFLLNLIDPLNKYAYYLPADRTGVMHAHSVVVESLIARAPMAGIRPAVGTSVLSGVLADFLEQLIRIDRINGLIRRKKQDHSAAIENLILRGSIKVTRSSPIDYPHFIYRPEGWKDDLELANASSMVSELAPVVLYLRHLVKSNNVLIVEEPESHLHPAMQVELVRQLATLIDKGIRVIVTTHSEWLLDELANIVRRSELPEAKRDNKATLNPEQVGVWLFESKKRPKGTVVNEVRLDECGLYPAKFENVAAALHNDWADITGHTQNDP